MSSEIQFKYFYGTESEMLTFYRIPKLLVTNDYFKKLTNDAKILYGLMLDRMSLSAKNHWFDKENRIYIYFSVEDIMEYINCGKNKALKTIAELDTKTGIGLIERKKQGLGKPDIIYVKNFFFASEKSDSEVYKVNFCKSTNETSAGLDCGLTEVCKEDPNKNNNNNTKKSEKSNLIGLSEAEQKRKNDIAGYAALIKDNIEYTHLLERHAQDKDIIDGIYELILETVLYDQEKILVAQNSYPSELVKSRLLKLDFSHIEYVLECMNNNTSKVRNIKKYMLAVLFNAPTTIGNYYQSEVNHDMANYAG